MFEIALIVFLGSLLVSLVSGLGLATTAIRRVPNVRASSSSRVVFVVAILVSIGALAWLWPGLQRSRQRSRQKHTMQTFREIGERLSKAADAGTAVDAWGNQVRISRRGPHMILRSPGMDGKFDSGNVRWGTERFEDDIVMVDGLFAQWPEGVSPLGVGGRYPSYDSCLSCHPDLRTTLEGDGG